MNWELDFKHCLDKRWLVSMPEAQTSFERGGYKWSTIQTYYAMFHAARALLYSRGFREKSHYCLAVSMRYLFVSRGLLEESLVDALEDARALQEDADYRMEFSKPSAEKGMGCADRFIKQVDLLLANWKEPSEE